MQTSQFKIIFIVAFVTFILFGCKHSENSTDKLTPEEKKSPVELEESTSKDSTSEESPPEETTPEETVPENKDPDQVAPIIKTIDVTGFVADGYIQNAVVCLDINNKACELDEPQTITDSEGKFSFSVEEELANVYPVVAIISAQSKDVDDLSRELQPYVMTAPAGKPEFISPITTMIQVMIESNPGLSIESAETAVKKNLGYSPTSTLSLFTDYLAATTADSGELPADKHEYKRIHRIAQVIARTLETNLEAVKTAANAAGLDENTILNELLSLVIKDVISKLQVITTEVDKINIDEPFDVDTATLASKQIDTSTIADNINAEKIGFTAETADIASALQDGIHFTRDDFDYFNLPRYSIEQILLNDSISGPNLEFSSENWNGGSWEVSTYIEDSTTRNCQSITPNGLLTYGCYGVESIRDNGDGTASLETKDKNGNIIETLTIRGNKFNLVGTRIRSAIREGFHFNKAIPGNAIFTTNATGFRWNFTTLNDTYRVQYQEAEIGTTCQDQGWGNTLVTNNCISLAGINGPVAAVTLSEVTDGSSEYYVGKNIIATFTPNTTDTTMGAVNYIARDYSTSPVTETSVDGIYTIEQPMDGNINIILFEIPRQFRGELLDSRDAKSFIVIDEGYARMGGFQPAGVTDIDDRIFFDTNAIADIKNCFMGGTVTSGSGSCPVELFLRDGNLPLAEGEPIAETFDSSKTMIPYTAPIDGSTIDFSSDGINSRWAFMFNADGTGTFTPASGSKAGTALAMTWQVLTDGRLKISRLNGDRWVVTNLDDGTTHVRRKRFNENGMYVKNFGGYMTDLNAP